MSDLTATNCGCGCDNGCGSSSGLANSVFGEGCGCSILWILLLCSLCGGNNGSLFSGNGNGCDGGNTCWIIILLLLFCNGNGCGSY